MKNIIILFFILSIASFSHPGRLDANGGHWNRKTGEYHYHRKISTPSVKSSTRKTSTNKVTQPKISKNNSKKNYIKTSMSEDEVYTRLILLGYRGPNALKDFQKDMGLKTDGIIGPKTIEVLKKKTNHLL
ncbi:YHYH domain-containing protein [Cetobacterium ceti]